MDAVTLKLAKQYIDAKVLSPFTNESWKIPTLLGTWVHSDLYGGVKYMKDSLGFVHIQGYSTRPAGGATGNIFVLPVGYRPDTLFLPIILTSTIGTPSVVASYIDSNGAINVYGTGVAVGFNLSFKAK